MALARPSAAPPPPTNYQTGHRFSESNGRCGQPTSLANSKSASESPAIAVGHLSCGSPTYQENVTRPTRSGFRTRGESLRHQQHQVAGKWFASFSDLGVFVVPTSVLFAGRRLNRSKFGQIVLPIPGESDLTEFWSLPVPCPVPACGPAADCHPRGQLPWSTTY